MHNNTNYHGWNKALTFGVGSIQLSFRTIVFTQYMQMFSIQMLLHFSQIVQRVCTLVLFINPRRACAARVTVVVLCVCMCVCVYVCMYICVYVCVSTHTCRLTHWNHKREIPTDSAQYRDRFKFACFTSCTSFF